MVFVGEWACMSSDVLKKKKEKKGGKERAFNVVTAFYQPRAQKE